MPDLPTSNPEQFYQVAPVLMVPDVPATAAFYRKILGFRSDPGTDTPEYTVVWRDNAAVHLAKGEQAPMGIRIFLWVRDVNAFYDGCDPRDQQEESDVNPQLDPGNTKDWNRPAHANYSADRGSF